MGVFDERDQEEKALAKEMASLARTTSAICAYAAVLAASAGASPVGTSLAGGFASCAAAAAVWQSVQSQIADDPPRPDWDTFCPPLPPRLDAQTRTLALHPRRGDGLTNWARLVTAHAYCLAGALASAERLAGLREDQHAPPFRSTHADALDSSNLHQALGRFFLTRATGYWRQLSGSDLGQAPSLLLNEDLGIQPERLIAAEEDLEQARRSVLPTALPKLRRSTGFTTVAWDLVAPAALVERVLTTEDVAAAQQVAPSGLMFSPEHTERHSRRWYTFARPTRADLSVADLRVADLQDEDLTNAHLPQADMSRAALRDTRLMRANLRGARLVGADLTGASLEQADLRGADLTGAILEQADFAGADLTGAILEQADLTGANLAGADLSDASLERAVLIRTNLRDTTLTHIKLNGALWNQYTVWPHGFLPPAVNE